MREQPSTTSSVRPAFAILGSLMAQPRRAWGVRELSERLAVSRSATNRVLVSLQNEGLARQDESDAYLAGPRIYSLANVAHARFRVFTDVRDLLVRTQRNFAGTLFLTVEDAGHRSCSVLVTVEADAAIRYGVSPGTVLPLYAGAAGLATLAANGTDPDDLDLVPLTSKTISDPRQLKSLLARSRRQGYVLSAGTRVDGAVGIAVWLSFDGEVYGSISLSTPESDFDPSTEAQSVEHLTTLARQVTETLAAPVCDPALPTLVGQRGGSDLVGRAHRLISALTYAARPVDERRLAAAVGAGPVGVRSVVDQARDSGLLRVRSDGKVVAGSTLLRWYAQVGTTRLADLLAAQLRMISLGTGETAGLALVHEEHGAWMETTLPGRNPVRYVIDAPAPIPLHAGAIGKAIFAHSHDRSTDIVLERYTPDTITDPAKLATELARIRDQGYAIGDNDRIENAYGIAVPFFASGQVAGALNVSFPRYRRTDEFVKRSIALLREAADQATRLLSP